MSDEETDGENKSAVRPVPLGWRCKELAVLMKQLSWHHKKEIGSLLFKRPGNRKLDRNPDPKDPIYAHVVKSLPINWYNKEWYDLQPYSEKRQIDAQTEHPVPVRDRYLIVLQLTALNRF